MPQREHFDVLVLGSGQGGQLIGRHLAQAGQQHEEAFKADFDPSEGLVGHWGLLGPGVKKRVIRGTFHLTRRIPLAIVRQSKREGRRQRLRSKLQITNEGGITCLTRL